MLKSQPLKNSINKSAFFSHQGRYECCVTLSDTGHVITGQSQITGTI